MNLISDYKSALQMCESCLIKMWKEQQYRGMEAVYHKALMAALKEKENRKFKDIRHERPLREISSQPVRRERVDIVVESNNSNVHAIELKVVQLPREKNLSPMQCLYDIGQITRDFIRLSEAETLTSFDCVIVLYGGLLSVYRTPATLLREFHNRMFVDFKTSEAAGQLKFEKNNSLRKKQRRLIKQLGLDQPFTRSTDSMRAKTSEKLGLITIHGPLS